MVDDDRLQQGAEPAADADGLREAPEPDAHAGPRDDAVTLGVQEHEELVKKAGERDDLFSRLQRKVAEFENYQKRVKRDRAAWEDAKVRRFVLDVLPAIDDLERLLDVVETDTVPEELRTACRLLSDKIMKILGDWRIEAIPAEGWMFDPHRHEALRHEVSDEAEPGAVLKDLRRGYTLGGEVLRASQVVVARAPQEAGATEVSESDRSPDPDGEDGGRQTAEDGGACTGQDAGKEG